MSDDLQALRAELETLKERVVALELAQASSDSIVDSLIAAQELIRQVDERSLQRVFREFGTDTLPSLALGMDKECVAKIQQNLSQNTRHYFNEEIALRGQWDWPGAKAKSEFIRLMGQLESMGEIIVPQRHAISPSRSWEDVLAEMAISRKEWEEKTRIEQAEKKAAFDGWFSEQGLAEVLKK